MPGNNNALFGEVMSIIRRYDPKLIAKDPYQNSPLLEIESTVINAIDGREECIYYLKMHLIHIDHRINKEGNIEGEYFTSLFSAMKIFLSDQDVSEIEETIKKNDIQNISYNNYRNEAKISVETDLDTFQTKYLGEV